MFKNYLIVAIRTLARHKAYTFINVIGLAIGLTCSTLIMLYLQYEFSYDRHHSKADRIHRVIAERRLSNGNLSYPFGVQGPIASALAGDFPEIERTTRFYRRPVDIRIDGKDLLKAQVGVVDAEFFNIFDYPLVKGNVQTGLQTPFSAFITQTLAYKLFGNEDPIGQEILIQSKLFDHIYTITGILKDMPKTTTDELAPELITATFSPQESTPYPQFVEDIQNDWNVYYAFTYILLKPTASVATLKEKMPDFEKRYLGDETAQKVQYKMMPLTQLHLHGRDYGVWRVTGDIQVCYAFGLIGILIVFVACINFMNLSTARSARRMREVGMRKAVGAKRIQLIYQFLGESILLSALALILALGLTELTLPLLNGFMDIQLSLRADLLPVLLVLAIGVGLLAGSYPALFLSSFKPTAALKSAPNTKGGHVFVRKGLVVIQFAISMVLIAATIIVFRQTEYMRTANLGFKSDALVEMRGLWGVKTQAEAMKLQFLQHAGVQNVTSMSRLVGRESNVDRQFVSVDGLENPIGVHYSLTDHDFLSTYQVPLLLGRNFRPGDYVVWEPTNAFKTLLNETAAKQLNVQVGDRIEFTGVSHEVLGVFKDFHNRSLHESIRPFMLICSRSDTQVYMTLRINTHNLPDVMAHLETVWKKFNPDRPSQFVFVNASFDQKYQSEIRLQKLYAICSGLAITIACLGLLGLIAYTAEVRTKEIGVRKVLGATEVSIVSLLAKEFMVLVALASVLAWPVAYYMMGGWLENFAYRIDLRPAYFIASTCVALVITLITIAYQALKAARANPVEALRYE
ncbi:MAG: FtsX-like permease family protein [Candidatus Latescibacteria bacterium]|nr:FtsX-like permease family protein [Candidatus Latescibacterota bacterium]MBT5831634.1 FtsX-like permease family protein [Candidatus Latescibacterota bacterium]